MICVIVVTICFSFRRMPLFIHLRNTDKSYTIGSSHHRSIQSFELVKNAPIKQAKALIYNLSRTAFYLAQSKSYLYQTFSSHFLELLYWEKQLIFWNSGRCICNLYYVFSYRNVLFLYFAILHDSLLIDFFLHW